MMGFPSCPFYYSQTECRLMRYFYWFFSGLCQQNPNRTFRFGNTLYVVCGRNTGIYIGIIFGIIILLLVYITRGRTPVNFPGLVPLMVLFLMATPMAIDAGLSAIGVWPSSNEIRLITGLYFGFAISAFISVPFFEILTRFKRFSQFYRVKLFMIWWELVVFIFLPLVLWTLIIFLKQPFFYISAASVFLSIWFGNLIFLLAILKNKVLKTAILAGLIAIFMALAEMALIASLRSLIGYFASRVIL